MLELRRWITGTLVVLVLSCGFAFGSDWLSYGRDIWVQGGELLLGKDGVLGSLSGYDGGSGGSANKITINWPSGLAADRTWTLPSDAPADGDGLLMGAANAMQWTPVYVPGGTDVSLADGGTGHSFTDPGGDELWFWDDSDGFMDWLELGTNLSISGKTLNATGGGAGTDLHFLTSQAEGTLSNEVNLGALTSGMLKHTVGGGVSTPATATEGTDYWKPGGTDVALADGGTAHSFADPNDDRIMFWDDSAGNMDWLDPDSSLDITTTTIKVAPPASSFELNAYDSDAGVITRAAHGPAYLFNDTGVAETIKLNYILPDNYDGGTVSCIISTYMLGGAGITTAYMTLDAEALTTGDTNGATSYGTAQATIIPSNPNGIFVAVFPALTIGNTPAAGKMVAFRLSRDSSNVIDNYAGAIGWYRMRVEYGTTALTE